MFSCKYFTFDETQIEEWKKTFPGVCVMDELLIMRVWLDGNPSRLKKNYHRFAVNWLTKEYRKTLQDKPRAGFSVVATLSPECVERLREKFKARRMQ